MNEIIVVEGEIVEDKSDIAIRGLMGELSANSRTMYSRAIEDFKTYAQNQGRSSFGDNLAVLFADYLRHLRDSGLAGSSVAVKRIQIRRYLEWCARVGMISQTVLYEANSVKIPKTQGERAGNWLSKDQMQKLLDTPNTETFAGRRDRAVLALLVGCALRRSEVVALTWKHLVRYEDQWVFKNISRKHGRTQAYIPVPDFVKKVIDAYSMAGKPDDKIIVSVDQHGNRGKSISVIGIYHIVKKYAEILGYLDLSPHDLRRSWSREARKNNLEVTQIQSMLGHASVATTQKYISEIMEIGNISKAVELEV